VLGLLRGLAGEGAVYQDGDRGPWKVANTPNSLTSNSSEVRELVELGESLRGISDEEAQQNTLEAFPGATREPTTTKEHQQ